MELGIEKKYIRQSIWRET